MNGVMQINTFLCASAKLSPMKKAVGTAKRNPIAMPTVYVSSKTYPNN